MTTRTVIISLLEQTPQARVVRFIPDIAALDGDVLLEKQYKVTTDANGDATIDLPVKATEITYSYEIPRDGGKSTGRFSIKSGAPISLDTLITTGVVSGGGGGGTGDVATDAIWDAKGDLAVGTGSNTAAVLPVGANNTFLTPDSSQTTGLKYITGSALKTLLSLVKGDVGLGNVDNTSDANKPVSSAQQTAINTKLGITNNLDDLGNPTTARVNLGLGTLAVQSDLGTVTHAASTKATPVDADEIGIADSAASFGLKRTTWAQVKAVLKTYFDTLYPAGSGTSTGTNTGDQYNDRINIRRALGSATKAETHPYERFSTTFSLTSGRMELQAIWLPVAGTLTGVKWWQAVAGNYTAAAGNQVALFTYSGGTLTLVASSTDDGNLWKASTQSFASKAFSSTYTAAAGLYFIGLLYNNNGTQSQVPQLVCGPSAYVASGGSGDYTNNAKAIGFVSGPISAVPSSQAMTGVSTLGIPIYLALY